MIYLLAIILPPLALLLNGQPFNAIFNLMLIVPCLILGLVFHPLLLVPSLVSLFGKWNWYLPDGVARLLRVPPSVLHEERSTAP